MQAKFEIKLAANGEYMFNLFATNGKIVATSETYTTLQSCMGGIESIRNNAVAHVEDMTAEPHEVLTCPKFELFSDKEGKFRFRLRASNGEIICASQGYTTKDSAMTGIASVKANAPVAAIVYLDQDF